jgi:hypothetical protein
MQDTWKPIEQIAKSPWYCNKENMLLKKQGRDHTAFFPPLSFLYNFNQFDISVLPWQYLVPELKHMEFNIAAELRY